MIYNTLHNTNFKLKEYEFIIHIFEIFLWCVINIKYDKFCRVQTIDVAKVSLYLNHFDKNYLKYTKMTIFKIKKKKKIYKTYVWK